VERAEQPPRMDMMFVQLIATCSVVLFITLSIMSFRCYRQRQIAAFLKSLPDASEDHTWLVVAYEWGGHKMQSGRMPLEGLSSISGLITAAVEYGAEHVDSEIREENVDVRYMDLQAVERRVGAKTRFADVAQARVLRICRRKLATIQESCQEERASLVTFSTRKPPATPTQVEGVAFDAEAPKAVEPLQDPLENDDHSLVVQSP